MSRLTESSRSGFSLEHKVIVDAIGRHLDTTVIRTFRAPFSTLLNTSEKLVVSIPKRRPPSCGKAHFSSSIARSQAFAWGLIWANCPIRYSNLRGCLSYATRTSKIFSALSWNLVWKLLARWRTQKQWCARPAPQPKYLSFMTAMIPLCHQR